MQRRIATLLFSLVALAGIAHGAARNLTGTLPTRTAKSVEVDSITIGRGGGSPDMVNVTGNYSDGSSERFSLLRVDATGTPLAGDCQGLRVSPAGRFEVFTQAPRSNCATQVFVSFRTASGTKAARLDAVDTDLAALGDVPP